MCIAPSLSSNQVKFSQIAQKYSRNHGATLLLFHHVCFPPCHLSFISKSQSLPCQAHCSFTTTTQPMAASNHRKHALPFSRLVTTSAPGPTRLVQKVRPSHAPQNRGDPDHHCFFHGGCQGDHENSGDNRNQHAVFKRTDEICTSTDCTFSVGFLT